MIFNKIFGEIPSKAKITERHAVRAVIFKEDKLLLVRTNKGDYKFPGGGKEKGETDQDTVIREVKEETGYQIASVNEMLGTMIQQNQDIYDKDAGFVMTSFYYQCTLTNLEKTELNLDQYEEEQQFTAMFVSLEVALESNEQLLASVNKDINPWVARDTYVLRELLNKGFC